MKRRKLSSQIRKALPVLVATTVLTACVGQEGDTNGGFAGVGLGGNAATAAGVVGGVLLAGALLADDDDSGSNGTSVGGTGDTADGGTDTDGDGIGDDVDTDDDNDGVDDTVDAFPLDGSESVDTDNDGIGNNADTDDDGDGVDDTNDVAPLDPTQSTNGNGNGNGNGGTDTDGDGIVDSVDTDDDNDGVDDTADAFPLDSSESVDSDGDGIGDNADTDNGGGTSAGGLILASDGSFSGEFSDDETVPVTNSSGLGLADLQFDTVNNTVTGCITVPAGMTPAPSSPSDVSAVSIMIGPPGSNGFVGIELEVDSSDRTKWKVPTTLSAAQINVVRENLLAGNLYVAARNNGHPNGEIRAQVTPPDVYKYTTTVTGTNGGNANGYVLVNEVTGDYAITWNTDDPTLISAHLNDGNVSGASETVFLNLTQRPSNPARFFAYGNFNDPNDQVPNLEALLSDGMAWLDAHAANDDRVFFGLLTKMD